MAMSVMVFMILWTLFKFKLATNYLMQGIRNKDYKLEKTSQKLNDIKDRMDDLKAKSSRFSFSSKSLVILSIISGVCLGLTDFIGVGYFVQYGIKETIIQLVVTIALIISILRTISTISLSIEVIKRLSQGFNYNIEDLVDRNDNSSALGFITSTILFLSGVCFIYLNLM